MTKQRISAVCAALVLLLCGCSKEQPDNSRVTFGRGLAHTGSTLTVDLSTAYASEPFRLRGGSLHPHRAVSAGLIASKEVKGKERYYLYTPETGDFTEFKGGRKETPSYAGELPDGRYIFLYNDPVGRKSGLDLCDGIHRSAEIYDTQANLTETFELPANMPQGYLSESTIAMDKDGNWFFIGSNDTSFTIRSGVPTALEGLVTGYYVLNPDFSLKGEMSVIGFQPDLFVQGESGALYGISNERKGGVTLSRLDCGSMTAQPLEQAVPTSTRCIMTGRGHELFYTLEDGIYSWDPEGDTALAVNFVNSDLSDSDCGWDGYSLPDGSFLIDYTDQDSYQTDFYRLMPRSDEELNALQIVTLAGVNISPMLVKDVVMFNKSRTDARIVMKDYGKEWVTTCDDPEVQREYLQAQREWREPDIDFLPAVEKFKSDLLTGTVPDIVCMDAVPYQILSNKGLLCDLMPLLREDPRFDESRYLENILAGLRRGERLERIGFSFTVDTMAAKTQFVGEQQHRTAEEYLAMLQSMPESMQYLPFNTREELIYTFLIKSQAAFIDKETLSCSFDQPTFVELLKTVNAVQPAELLYADDKDYNDAIEYGYNYSEDHTLLCPMELSRPMQFHQVHFQNFRQADITLVGYPESTEGNGGMFKLDYTIALTSQSSREKQVTDFIVQQLSTQRQAKFCIEGWNSARLPLMREMLENSMLGASRGYHAGGNMTVQEVDVLMDYIEHVTMYQDIDPAVTRVILEEAGKLFAGDCTAESAAKAIQSRVSLYLAEQY